MTVGIVVAVGATRSRIGSEGSDDVDDDKKNGDNIARTGDDTRANTRADDTRRPNCPTAKRGSVT